MGTSFGLSASVYLADMKIDSVVGLSEAAPGETDLHTHPYYELFSCLSGAIRITYSDGELVLRDGESCIVAPMLYHSSSPASEDAFSVAVRFRLLPTAARCPEPMYASFCSRLSAHGTGAIDDRGRIAPLILAVSDEARAGGEMSAEYADAILRTVYLEIYRVLGRELGAALAARDVKATEESLRPLVIDEFLYFNAARSITEEDLARELGLSSRQVSRVLSDVFGRSFRQLLIEYRLKRAAELLSSSADAVEEVAQKVGYSSVSGFYSAFTARYGVSPAKYRKNASKNP